MSILEQRLARKSAAAREAALRRYRELLARCDAPEPGDEEAIVEAMKDLGLTEADLHSDLQAVSEFKAADAIARDTAGALLKARAAKQAADGKLDALVAPLQREANDARERAEGLRRRLNSLAAAPSKSNLIDELSEQIREAEHISSRAEAIIRIEASRLYGQRSGQAFIALQAAEKAAFDAAFAARRIKSDPRHHRVFGDAAAIGGAS